MLKLSRLAALLVAGAIVSAPAFAADKMKPSAFIQTKEYMSSQSQTLKM